MKIRSISPGENGEYVTTDLTKEEAIAYQRRSCVQARGKDLYETDADALDDYMIVNWAWEVEDDE